MTSTTVAAQLKKHEERAKRERLELAMLQQLKALKLDLGMVREWKFDEVRAWRFDFAWPARLMALEVEGGIWSEGRHVRARGFIADAEKYANAAIYGWRVIRASGDQVLNGSAAAWMQRAFER